MHIFSDGVFTAIWVCSSVAIWVCSSAAMWVCSGAAIWVCSSAEKGPISAGDLMTLQSAVVRLILVLCVLLWCTTRSLPP
jgi:hypothetical protein